MLHTKGYTALINWFSAQSPILSHHAKEAACAVAISLDKQWSASSYTCGFEFHHYQSSHDPDFLVFGDTTKISNPNGIGYPPWWSTYENNIISLKNKISDLTPSFSIPSDNWLEFDMKESSLILAGIWQGVVSNPNCCLEQWSLLSQALACGFNPDSDLQNSIHIRNFINFFSLPNQVGMMFNRGNFIKLMVPLFGYDEIRRLKNYIEALGFKHIPRLKPIIDGLIEIGPILRPAISIDIDLNDTSSFPMVALEIHQKKQKGRNMQPETSKFLEYVCKIDSSQILDLNNCLAYLPSGLRSRRLDFVEGLSIQTRIAELNHLKVSISSNAVRLKSYVRLVEHNHIDHL